MYCFGVLGGRRYPEDSALDRRGPRPGVLPVSRVLSPCTSSPCSADVRLPGPGGSTSLGGAQCLYSPSASVLSETRYSLKSRPEKVSLPVTHAETREHSGNSKAVQPHCPPEKARARQAAWPVSGQPPPPALPGAPHRAASRLQASSHPSPASCPRPRPRPPTLQALACLRTFALAISSAENTLLRGCSLTSFLQGSVHTPLLRPFLTTPRTASPP